MKKILLLLVLLTNGLLAYAQLEHKFTFTAALGAPFYAKAGDVQGENIYAGYSSIPGIRLGMQYNLNDHFGFGPVVGQFYGTKANYSLTMSQVGIALKYNIVPFDKVISPFITLEGDLNYITIAQKANAATENVSSSADPDQIQVNKQIHNYPEIKTGFASTGLLLGAGSDFTIKKRYTLFGSLNYVLTNSSESYTSKSLFSENKSKLDYFLVQVGIRFAFGQSKSMY